MDSLKCKDWNSVTKQITDYRLRVNAFSLLISVRVKKKNKRKYGNGMTLLKNCKLVQFLDIVWFQKISIPTPPKVIENF